MAKEWIAADHAGSCAVNYDHVAAFLREIFDCCDVSAIAFDRVFMKFLRPCLVRAGFTDEELEKFIEYGQGFLSMTPAIRELETRLLEKKLKHGNHPVLTMRCECSGGHRRCRWSQVHEEEEHRPDRCVSRARDGRRRYSAGIKRAVDYQLFFYLMSPLRLFADRAAAALRKLATESRYRTHPHPL